jgi:hydroxymethylglutaryl-CoA lyase
MLNGMGIEHGVQLDKLIATGNWISKILGKETRSKVATAITRKTEKQNVHSDQTTK